MELDLETNGENQLPSPPEPLMVFHTPPPFLPVPGEPAMPWDKWYRSFEQYLEALSGGFLEDSGKCTLLEDCLGQEGQRVYRTLVQNKTTYTEVISTLSDHFSSSHNFKVDRFKFRQRAQRPGESVEQFVSALQELVKTCNYGALQDELIVDQLIEKTSCKRLRERLLLEQESLTLARALTIGKQVEYDLTGGESLAVQSVSLRPELAVHMENARETRGLRSRRVKRPSSLFGRDKDNNHLKDAKQCSSGDGSRTDDSSDENRGSSDIENEDYRDYAKDEDYEFEEGLTDDSTDEEVNHSKPSKHCRPAPTNRRRGRSSSQSTGQSKKKALSCSVCSNAFPSSYQLERHLREQHNSDAMASCKDREAGDEEQSSNDKDDDDDSGHGGGERKDFAISNTGQKHVCTICSDRSFRDADKLSRHMRTHTKEKPFTCPVCDKTFSQSYHRTRHIRSQHKDYKGDDKDSGVKKKKGKMETEGNHEPTGTADADDDDDDGDGDGDDGGVEGEGDADGDVGIGSGDEDPTGQKKNKRGHFCPYCTNKSFRGANKLARHMRKHTKEKPFSCPVCAKTFSQSYHKNRHLRNQHGVDQYICSICGLALHSWVELQTHKARHIIHEIVPCPHCGEKFKGKRELSQHIIKERADTSNPSNVHHLVCTDCGKAFNKMFRYRRHLTTHDKSLKKKPHQCPVCEKSYVFPKELNKHLEMHQKEKEGACLKCDQTFSSPEELEIHMKTHEKSYPCTICGKNFKVEYALKKHKVVHSEQRFYCSVCDKQFPKLSHFQRHQKVHSRREIQCPHCEKIFLKSKPFKDHLRAHVKERPHQCSFCVESFTQREELERHCMKHKKFKKEKPYSCSRCEFAFATLDELTVHMTLHKGEQAMNCPECGMSFLNKKKLEKHLTIHTGERPHLCSICGHGFPCMASLKMHMHVHTGEKPFPCTQCDKSYASSSGLRMHSRIHMAVRPTYSCQDCGRTYGRMTELKMHQRYHTGDKPYACSVCSKRFVRKDKLSVHMRIHTGERPYGCSHCGQTFTQAGDRNRHMSKCH